MSLANRISRKSNRMRSKVGGDVILRWRARTGEGTFDPILDGSNPDFAWAERNETLKAMIHYVDIHTTGYTRFSEVKTGDVILEFDAGVDIDSKEGLEFDIGGVLYVQKNAGKELAKSWDVRISGVPINRTVLVTLKS
jgi:hypothetical protein